MGALALKYDSEYDSWVLEPIHVPNTKPKAIPISDQRHSSTETFASSAAPTPPKCSFSLKMWSFKKYWNCFKPSTDHNDHDHHQSHDYHHSATTRTPKKEKQKIEPCVDDKWSFNKKHWNCFNPSSDHNDHQNHHQSHDHHQSATTRTPKKDKQKIKPCDNNNTNNLTCITTNAEERDEKLKAVILYCKSTLS